MGTGYNERKAAHVAAFFAIKAGGKINILAMTKLAYLGDREFLKLYDSPILFDRLVSMPHGPVDSLMYSLSSGQMQSADWDAHMQSIGNYMLACRNGLTTDDLDELSDAEMGALEGVWNQFGHLDRWALRDYTHDNCDEWEDPHGSSNPIPYSRVLKVLGKDHAEDIADRIESERSLARIMRP
jgi:uncharacterized phage-associated protein